MKRRGIYKFFSLVLSVTFVFTGFMKIDNARAENISETVLLSEDFDNGISEPAGWVFDGINSAYANTGDFGTASPSLKFDKSGESITTPVFSNPSRLTFWVKGMSAQSGGILISILKEGRWEALDYINSIASEGTVKTYALNGSVTQVKFMHVGGQGEFALDDVKIYGIISDGNPSTDVTRISNVRTDSNKDGVLDQTGKSFTVQGSVTAVLGSIPYFPYLGGLTPNGDIPISSGDDTVISNQRYYNTIYIQDETGGIAVTGLFTKDISLGMTIKAAGILYQSQGEARLAAENSNITIQDSSTRLVEPKAMSTKDSVLEANEGWLVRVVGKVTRIIPNGLYVNDGTGEARILVDSVKVENIDYSTSSSAYNPAFKAGDTVAVTGISSEDMDGHKIRVRNISDIVKGNVPVTPGDTNKIVPVKLNKTNIVINQGKFEYVNIITTPGNAIVGTISCNKSSIVTISQDKKNKRLLKITANQAGTQVVEITVTVNGHKTTLKLNVKVQSNKALKGKGKH